MIDYGKKKTIQEIMAQAERLSETNWRRKNTWAGSIESRMAKESRDRLIDRAERNTLRINGYSAG